ncbi:uncharacterized protein FOMMEDRAFT_93408 [Fomitiporia mediterranea MF3/22]|uniref:uncharacterized protein n=1 Tax=Fomitiporia mediterranea (strain MF3/22) TaxID=694068 RepID=UPI0004409B2A|nr:uncharacterized protein FOMMEDRAFT_93408 [Fomitiporia mediterranea MF3/22]EJC99725.1 hypothetical protein FOMMEDRAFT_93408 [Fomitiporia mediterranea MF3/22]
MKVNENGLFVERRLPQLQFYCHTDPSAFGFIDPDLILQGAHLILQFSKGTIQTLLPPSLACQPKDKNEDYKFYFVNV